MRASCLFNVDIDDFMMGFHSCRHQQHQQQYNDDNRKNAKMSGLAVYTPNAQRTVYEVRTVHTTLTYADEDILNLFSFKHCIILGYLCARQSRPLHVWYVWCVWVLHKTQFHPLGVLRRRRCRFFFTSKWFQMFQITLYGLFFYILTHDILCAKTDMRNFRCLRDVVVVVFVDHDYEWIVRFYVYVIPIYVIYIILAFEQRQKKTNNIILNRCECHLLSGARVHIYYCLIGWLVGLRRKSWHRYDNT